MLFRKIRTGTTDQSSSGAFLSTSICLMLEIDIKRGQNDMVSDLSQLVQTIPTDLSSVNSTTAYI